MFNRFLVFTYLYSCLPMFATVYSFSNMFTNVYSCMFTRVHLCLYFFPMITAIYFVLTYV